MISLKTFFSDFYEATQRARCYYAVSQQGGNFVLVCLFYNNYCVYLPKEFRQRINNFLEKNLHLNLITRTTLNSLQKGLLRSY